MADEKNDKILLGHGSGGRLTRELIEKLFRRRFDNPALNPLGDSAVLDTGSCARLAFTTDSFVVKPPFFPGGDIGKLAICGTVNDLAVSGARPMFISAAAIIEEGFAISDLEKIASSMQAAADEAGVKIVTGDTKVVEKGSADGIFINTSGIGALHPAAGDGFSEDGIGAGDAVIISGAIAEHGLAVLKARGGFEFKYEIVSDCAPLWGPVKAALDAGIAVKFMRDPTRGGLAAVLNEIVYGRKFGIDIEERSVPVKEEVRAVCAILGFDPLYVANEGKFVMICAAADAEKAVSLLRLHSLGKNAFIIGRITAEHAGRVVMKTAAGGSRIVDMPIADQLPRIC
jgi:hydrogenase expression/formation protein HypE